MAAIQCLSRGLTLAALAAVALAGCESSSVSLSKKIDYKSTASAPSLELPPDLTTPQYDDRYTVTTASGLAAQGANRPRGSDAIAPNATAEARVVRGGTERWLVVKTSPEIGWGVSRQFWIDTGFAIALEQPTLGLMETDWAENRAELPPDFLRNTVGKVADIFYNTYKRDKFRTRIERGAEAGTIEIYISHRGMEQVPTTMTGEGKVSPAGFVWAVMPPNPGLEAEMLTRMMMRFGTAAPQAAQAVAAAAPGSTAIPDRARLEKSADGVNRLVVDDGFDRAWRRVGLALDRIGFTVVDRDRSKGVYFVRYADPDIEAARKDKESGFLTKLMFWRTETPDKPEQYRILVAQLDPRSIVTVEDPNGAPDKTATGEKILGLLKDQLK
jgi:outer membrane protein assembly factor BamC